MWPTGIWEWQPLRVGLKLAQQESEIFLSVWSFVTHSARAVFPVGIQGFLFFFFPFFPLLPDQASLQVEELALIQILCKRFVPFLSFCSCLIELCCFVSTITMTPLFLHSHFLFDCVSCLSPYTGENVRDHQSLDYNAAA